jgi:beta-galactosidase
MLLAWVLSPCASGAAVDLVTVDARTASQAPGPSSYRGGTSISTTGRVIGMNSMYLTLDGSPWLPVAGEFHFSRVPESEWEDEILKMKAAGVDIVSTYIIWIHHEEAEGQFDWSGRRDLHHFVELCARHGLYVIARIGPWAHGETRNGGFPDWLLQKGPTRRNDPVYMRYVAAYYLQIAQQLKGLLWKDGGPVIGIQLENEYSGRGPGQGEEYILALKKLALQDGLDVPLYTLTGWDNAAVPAGEVLPVFGGYPDAPWDASLTDLPPNEVYAFRFGSRISGNMGMIGQKSASPSSTTVHPDTPFLTAELGGGVQDTYHRRPVIEPDDIAAMMPLMLGSGVNLYGTYMFQGGENPDGQLTTLQESQATGYPTDVPTKSYDFQAPLSEYGRERESFRKQKVFDYFLNDFGSELAAMSVHAPARTPNTPDDFSVIRASVRSSGQQGFLFVNNYVRGAAMPARKAAQFEIQLPSSTLRIPETPIDIPSGAYFIWPFNLKLGKSTLRYSTAQLFTRIADPLGETYLFEEIPGIAAEFVFEDAPDLSVLAIGAAVGRHNGMVSITNLPTGLSHSVTLRRGTEPEIRLVLLTRTQAENTWKTRIAGAVHLVGTEQNFFADENSFVLQSENTPRCEFNLYPEVHNDLKLTGGSLRVSHDDGVSHYAGSVPEQHVEIKVKKLQDAAQAPPVKLGPALSWRPKGVAMAPPDSAFNGAAKWQLSVSRRPPDDTSVSNLFLAIDYTGDVARLSANQKLLADHFYNGLPWSVGLHRFSEEIGEGPLELSILPLRGDAPIFLERRFRPAFGNSQQQVELKGVTLLTQYQFRVETVAK